MKGFWACCLAAALAVAGCDGGKHLEEAEALSRKAEELTAALQQLATAGNAGAYALTEQDLRKTLKAMALEYELAGVPESDDPALLLEYAEVQGRLSNWDLAANALRRAAELKPEDAKTWGLLGQAEAELGPSHATEAVEALRRVLELEPEGGSAALAHALLGRIFTDQSLYALARKHYERALELNPDRTASRIALAALDIREGRLEQASEALDALAQTGADAEAANRGLITEAVAAFDATRQTITDEAAKHLAYAKLLVRAGRIEDCLWPLGRALELDPNNYIAWNMAGSIRQGMGQTDRAREAFERSLQVNPDQPRTRESLEQLSGTSAPGAATPTPAPGGAPASTQGEQTAPGIVSSDPLAPAAGEPPAAPME